MLVGAASAGFGLASSRILGSTLPEAPKPSFRFAHLTDLHIKGKHCALSVSNAIDHAMTRSKPPEMILTGGDLIYDSMGADERNVVRQWKNFHKAFSNHSSIPTEHILGNHDIWGVDLAKSKTTGKEVLYGKKWAMQELGLSKVYRSFDKGGWHFILLDDVMAFPEENRYEGRLDSEQFKWLEKDLATTNPDMPVIVLSHVPILGASVFFPVQTSSEHQHWRLPYSMMHADAHELVSLFDRHANVKVCLSGHTHLVDRVDFKGVSYLCNGAVCGNWWSGAFQGFAPGYSLIDLYLDGTFGSSFQNYDLA